MRLFSYDEARAPSSMWAGEFHGWMVLAQNSDSGAYPLVLEDGPEIPEAPGPHAEEGGQVLQGVYADGCPSIMDARNQ
jgi:hypothetical protein